MAVREYRDIYTYIDYVERNIIKNKNRQKVYFGDLEVKFEKDSMAENVKIYFELKGYQVEMHRCKSCSYYDFVFSWSK